jgi:hypothetical protein
VCRADVKKASGSAAAFSSLKMAVFIASSSQLTELEITERCKA